MMREKRFYKFHTEY